MRDKIKRKDIFYVYIVKCKNGTYYIGYTNDLKKRIELHNKGNGAKYLKGKAPVKLVYAKEYKYYKNALSAEKNMKKLTRKEKEGLIKNYETDPHRFVTRCFTTRRFVTSNQGTGTGAKHDTGTGQT